MPSSTLSEKLQRDFGFSEFRPGQETCIRHLLDGHSSLAIFPTGSGKSLCYQFTALQLPHLTLVVSPLLALMKDQVDFLQRKGIAAASLDSSLTGDEYQQVVTQLRQGQLKILMVSVERFKNERFRQLIQTIPISLLVVDEAHCISEWGHNFRPDYLKLPHYCAQLNIPTVLLLTATATKKVKRDMAEKFAIQSQHIVQTGFYRQNLHIAVKSLADSDKKNALVQTLNTQTGCGIVYVTLQQQAEDVAAFLQSQGFVANAYHAGLESERRQHIQQSFMTGDVPIIVATIAFGMGVDKADIRFVVHYDLPKSIENFSQEIGRAGRDGLDAQCVIFANLDGLSTLENFVYGDTPALWGIERLLKLIAHETKHQQWEMQANAVSFDTNIRLLTLKTLLVQLELLDVLETRYAYYAEYKIKYLRSVDDIVGMFDGERANFIQAIVDHAPVKRTWAEVDMETLCRQYPCDRGRVVKALDFLHDKGLIECQAKGMVDVYGVNTPALNRPGLADELLRYFREKETKEISRIAQLIRFFELDSCLSRNLARYFDDQQAPDQCGHCSVCLGKVAQLKRYDEAPWPSQEQMHGYVEGLTSVVQEQLSLRDVQMQLTSEMKTQFLVGLTTPWFTRFKVRQLPGFGQCSRQRFNEVLERL